MVSAVRECAPVILPIPPWYRSDPDLAESTENRDGFCGSYRSPVGLLLLLLLLLPATVASTVYCPHCHTATGGVLAAVAATAAVETIPSS